MTRRAERIGAEWRTPEGGSDAPFRWEHVAIEVLMDIREELRQLNALLACRNFIGIPATLRKIDRNTAPKRAPRKPKGEA